MTSFMTSPNKHVTYGCIGVGSSERDLTQFCDQPLILVITLSFGPVAWRTAPKLYSFVKAFVLNAVIFVRSQILTVGSMKLTSVWEHQINLGDYMAQHP
jgi:hypothetical protein